jgi:hypothetical protein
LSTSRDMSQLWMVTSILASLDSHSLCLPRPIVWPVSRIRRVSWQKISRAYLITAHVLYTKYGAKRAASARGKYPANTLDTLWTLITLGSNGCSTTLISFCEGEESMLYSHCQVPDGKSRSRGLWFATLVLVCVP